MKNPLVSTNAFSVLVDQAEELNSTATTSGVDIATGSSSGSSTNAHTHRKLKDPLVWIDLEMTGLDIEKDTIIEVACIVTDGELGIHVEGPSMSIHHSEEVLSEMNDWCKEHHGESGLTQRVRDSKVDMRQAELQLLQFVRQHCPDPGCAQLAGNSVHVDRMFMLKYMPELTAHLSYRIVDVSTIKELARRWFPAANRKAPRKVCAHTALSDIRESIKELQYFRKAIFLGGGRGGR
ncbi:hypothetical protein CEUSTIGMA_g10928.t1 [Chlamydomonas eustigma]|uniref:Exonuclease domain-containing protein n=1 Tax=Chlamydomonas eustigma TaxID=1157962 RepID=A0A250XKE5_9CHLO|nr:hypothetical protein CEUSTIGMA_g10928.t1 [Chlamydomonas eustigma]|eukprot:GAX83503.1 hypothetical protein CEUSTIGMA_g10928.t1 [Chlamydomonas eustigma]